jgi:hypothetical protein
MAHEKTKTKEPPIEPDTFVIPFTVPEWCVISSALVDAAWRTDEQADKMASKQHDLEAEFLLGCADGLIGLAEKIDDTVGQFREQYLDALTDRIEVTLQAREEHHEQ